MWYKGARPATLPCQNMCATIFGVCKIEMSNCIRLILMSTLTYDNSYNYLLLALCFVCFFGTADEGREPKSAAIWNRDAERIVHGAGGAYVVN